MTARLQEHPEPSKEPSRARRVDEIWARLEAPEVYPDDYTETDIAYLLARVERFEGLMRDVADQADMSVGLALRVEAALGDEL